MFTGIVEELGELQSMQHYGNYARLQIRTSKILESVQQGDSIAINGVCQTVEEFDEASFTVAAFAETLAKTSLGQLQRGAALHLERALTPNTQLGGHIVQGHVDGTGRLREVRHIQDNHYLRLDLPGELLDLCVLHGSICLDGVSLTIAKLHEDGLEVNLISYTWEHTLFRLYRAGTAINVECDILGKYILRFAHRGLIRPPRAGSDQRLFDLLQGW